MSLRRLCTIFARQKRKKRDYMRQPSDKRPVRRFSDKDIKRFKVEHDDTLLNYLLALFGDKSRTTVKSYLTHRQVAVNDMPVTQFDTPLHAGDELKINFKAGFRVFQHSRLRLVYEDEYILVIDKGYGLLSMSTDRIKTGTAYSILSDYVKSQNPENKLFIVHRLDRDTSGLMMFAKSKGIQEQMQHNWHNLVLERKYVAVVEGAMEQKEGMVRSYLAENAAFQVYSTDNPEEGQLAITRYKVLGGNKHFSLVELNLATGRKNQIRVHLHDLGHSIAGDRKYGAHGSPLGRVALHAYKLRFAHPVTRKEMNFETPIPPRFLSITAGPGVVGADDK